MHLKDFFLKQAESKVSKFFRIAPILTLFNFFKRPLTKAKIVTTYCGVFHICRNMMCETIVQKVSWGTGNILL